MPQKYLGPSFDTIEGDCTNATVSLVGSHLQNVCVEIESDGCDMSFILSPRGARKMVKALQGALADLGAEPAVSAEALRRVADEARADIASGGVIDADPSDLP